MYKRLERNDPCWCGSGKKYKTCHASFDDKIIQLEHSGFRVPSRELIKTPKDIEGIKKSAVINMAVLDEIGEKIHAGMSTQEIDDIVYNTTTKMGGIPADLNYEGFPKSCCISINEVVEQKLAVIDLTASIMCMENHMPLQVFSLNEENGITYAMNGENHGTIVTA